MLHISTNPIFANNHFDEKLTNYEGVLKNSLVNFYEGGTSEINFYQNGKLFPRNKFYSDTIDYFINNDFEALNKYIAKNQISVEHNINKKDIGYKGLDKAITRQSLLSSVLNAKDYQGATVEVTCELRGTVYYNPNTYVVTSVSNPIVLSIYYSNTYTQALNIVPSSYKSTYAGYFNVRFDSYNSYLHTYYDRFISGFTIFVE